ncbi:putative sensor domain DACNV-containing protein, partial [Longimicrobium sp.]|uniref:putative sensor domain DACNV-containing protein n=1 Tax=Longimicrobium sp. TaxID=2029185 RepID=UPI002E2F0B74
MHPGYPAARAVALTVVEHLATHLAMAQAAGVANLAPHPDVKTTQKIIDVAFWASLQREEGRSPRISLAYVPPEAAGHAMVFDRPFSLNAKDLGKLSPAVERPGIHLGVWPHRGELRVWGTG